MAESRHFIKLFPDFPSSREAKAMARKHGGNGPLLIQAVWHGMRRDKDMFDAKMQKMALSLEQLSNDCFAPESEVVEMLDDLRTIKGKKRFDWGHKDEALGLIWVNYPGFIEAHDAYINQINGPKNRSEHKEKSHSTTPEAPAKKKGRASEEDGKSFGGSSEALGSINLTKETKENRTKEKRTKGEGTGSDEWRGQTLRDPLAVGFALGMVKNLFGNPPNRFIEGDMSNMLDSCLKRHGKDKLERALNTWSTQHTACDWPYITKQLDSMCRGVPGPVGRQTAQANNYDHGGPEIRPFHETRPTDD